LQKNLPSPKPDRHPPPRRIGPPGGTNETRPGDGGAGPDPKVASTVKEKPVTINRSDSESPARPLPWPRAGDQALTAVATPTRPLPFHDAFQAAAAAIDELLELQSEYQSWLDGLPENLQSSAVSEKLDTVCGLDFEGAQAIIDEANDADLPLGFGRD
jgi:hypothetical protein